MRVKGVFFFRRDKRRVVVWRDKRRVSGVHIMVLVVVVLVGVFFSLSEEWQRRRRELAVWSLVRRQSAELGVDPYLVMAIISVESNFNPVVRGRCSEIGLMQIMPHNAQKMAQLLGWGRLSWWEVERPLVNIRLGVLFLRNLVAWKRRHLLPSAWFYPILITEYNAGWGRVERWLKLAREGGDWLSAIEIASTRRYVRRVLAEWQRYRCYFGRELGA
ncbi:MAG: lytic transglycosylase domain-containing protein [Planctomycetota bacterium]|nr:MAG: lytic transglycosylase domain-containing protein [Planctomycetota bacterium]